MVFQVNYTEILFLVAFILLASFALVNIVYQVRTKNKCKISFGDFKVLYSANPYLWTISRYIFSFSHAKYCVWNDRWRYSQWKEIYMNSYIDCLWLALFAKAEERNRIKKASAESMRQLSRCWQEDVDKAIKKIEENK